MSPKRSQRPWPPFIDSRAACQPARLMYVSFRGIGPFNSEGETSGVLHEGLRTGLSRSVA